MSDKGYQFVCKLFNDYQFKGTQWEVDAQMDSYYNAIKEWENGREYDYNRFYKLLEREYKKKTLPTKFGLRNFMQRCAVNNADSSRDGQLLVFRCYSRDENGNKIFRHIYDFTIDSSEYTKCLTTYQAQMRERYEFVEADFSPVGSTLMGSAYTGYSVYYPEDSNGEIYKKILVKAEEVA